MTTLTKIAGPNPIGPGLKMAVYSLLWDSNYPTGGEIVNISGEFTKCYAIIPSGNDTLADNGYSFAGVFDYTATVTATNVKISVNWEKNPADGGGADIAFPEFTNTGDLSSIGQFMFTVIGK